MKHRRFAVTASCCAAASLALAASVSPPAPTAAQSPAPTDQAHLKALYTEKCGACHNLPDPLEKGYTRAEWQRTVNTMLNKYDAGTLISPSEAGYIVNYLATFAPTRNSGRGPVNPWATDMYDVWTVSPTATHVFNFEAGDPLTALSPLPAGTAGPPAVWHTVVGTTPDGTVMKETPVKPNPSRFALLMDRQDQGRNIDVKVRFQIQSGALSPAVGIAFGLAGPKSYHVLRFDAQHNALSLLKIDEPTHTTLQTTPVADPAAPAASLAASVSPMSKPAAPGWHTLRLLVNNGRIRGWVDMEKRISTQDNGYAGGRIGLWTQGDTVALFDDWTVDLYDPQPSAAKPVAVETRPQGPAPGKRVPSVDLPLTQPRFRAIMGHGFRPGQHSVCPDPRRAVRS